MGHYSILTIMISAIFLFGKYILRLGLAHKLLDTFEKMDAINPTFELIDHGPSDY